MTQTGQKNRNFSQVVNNSTVGFSHPKADINAWPDQEYIVTQNESGQLYFRNDAGADISFTEAEFNDWGGYVVSAQTGQSGVVRTREEHPDDTCIAHLAHLMREKMKFSREVKGRGGWQDMPAEVLSEMLREHVEKGDPVDVANFCMMLAAKRAPIAEARGAEEQRRKDAEGQEPVYQVYKDDYYGWFDCTKSEWEIDERDPDRKRILYTRPANVAAMEARVKDLEAENGKFRNAMSKIAAHVGGFASPNCSVDFMTSAIPEEVRLSFAALTREGGV